MRIDRDLWNEYIEALKSLRAALEAAEESQQIVGERIAPLREFVSSLSYRQQFGHLPMPARNLRFDIPDEEPELTEKEYAEQERNSHLHP